jgi:hypothetical protein
LLIRFASFLSKDFEAGHFKKFEFFLISARNLARGRAKEVVPIRSGSLWRRFVTADCGDHKGSCQLSWSLGNGADP